MTSNRPEPLKGVHPVATSKLKENNLVYHLFPYYLALTELLEDDTATTMSRKEKDWEFEGDLTILQQFNLSHKLSESLKVQYLASSQVLNPKVA